MGYIPSSLLPLHLSYHSTPPPPSPSIVSPTCHMPTLWAGAPGMLCSPAPIPLQPDFAADPTLAATTPCCWVQCSIAKASVQMLIAPLSVSPFFMVTPFQDSRNVAHHRISDWNPLFSLSVPCCLPLTPSSSNILLRNVFPDCTTCAA